jgi:hypothetical protein
LTIIAAATTITTTIIIIIITAWSRVLLEKLRIRAASQEIPRILWNFITVYTRASH